VPASERSKEYRLTVIRRDGQPGPSITLDRSEVVCGRTEGDLVLKDDLSVSPRHAQFSLQDGAVWVTDLGSVNGTFVRLRTSRSLAHGDEIRLGHQLLRLEPLPRRADRPADSPDGSRPWGSPDAGYRLRLVQLLEGGGLGEVFPLKSGENTIGREVGDIHFSYDRFVSARHAWIEISENAVTLIDQGSSNGTFVRINSPTALQPGDQLLVGIQLLRLE
jgi:pSer/pThr/pTyr-binding forkhead associated (FHA) protein